MADAYHTSVACVTASNAEGATNTGKAPKAGRHGPTLSVWRGMRDRCNNEKAASYPSYGGRGIAVCKRWNDSFEAFLADMGERPEGRSIDRIDNDGNYEPGNCRWATQKEQARNTRSNVLYDYEGERVCVAELAERCGLEPAVLRRRLELGMSLDMAMSRAVGQTAEPPSAAQIAMHVYRLRRLELERSGLTADQIANRAFDPAMNIQRRPPTQAALEAARTPPSPVRAARGMA